MWAMPHALATSFDSNGFPLFLVLIASGILMASSRVMIGKERRGFFPFFAVPPSSLLCGCMFVAFFVIGFYLRCWGPCPDDSMGTWINGEAPGEAGSPTVALDRTGARG